MKSNGILVKKEQLRSNYKLTFNNGGRDFFVILNQQQRKIFCWLMISKRYFFEIYQNGSKYSFINPYSIKKIKQKTTLLQEQVRKYRLKNLSEAAINEKITLVRKAKNKTLLTKSIDAVKLEWVKDKSNKKLLPQLNTKDKKRQKDLSKLKVWFYRNWVEK